jgi:hypothetical protein
MINLKEFIDIYNHYNINTLKENNKIGFYQFKTDKNVIYNVNLGIYKNNISNENFTSLNIDFTANGSWDLTPNNKDTYKTLSTIAKIIDNYYNKNKNNIDYISYVVQGKNKKHKLYQYMLSKLNIPISNVFKHGSDVYSKINKNTNESKLISMIIEEVNNIKKDLGSGHFGKAIQKGDKVFKITTSVDEYALAKKIKESRKKFDTLPHIYGTRKLNEKEFLIIREFIDKDISDDLGENVGENLDEIIDFFFEKNNNINKSQTNLTELFESKFLMFLENLKKEIILLGYKAVEFDIEGLPNNIGIDKNNNYKLFDF